MATQTLEFDYVAGQSLTAKLFPLSSDTQEGGDAACVEAANRDGLYTAAFEDVPAGQYKLRVYLGGVFVGAWIYELTLTTATFREVASAAVASLSAAALAAVRTAVAGAVVLSTSAWPKAGYIAPRLGYQYGAGIGRPLGSVYSAAALPWVTAGAAFLDITVGDTTVTFTGTASIDGGQITTDFACVAADWGALSDGEGSFVAYQITGGERRDIEGGRATVRPKEGP